MRYLTLAEALTIAEAVTGVGASTLARASRLELLDSALHAPQAGFGEVEFHPEFVDKAAALVVSGELDQESVAEWLARRIQLGSVDEP